MKEKIGARLGNSEWRVRKRNSTGGQTVARVQGPGAKPGTLYTDSQPLPQPLMPLREDFWPRRSQLHPLHPCVGMDHVPSPYWSIIACLCAERVEGSSLGQGSHQGPQCSGLRLEAPGTCCPPQATDRRPVIGHCALLRPAPARARAPTWRRAFSSVMLVSCAQLATVL